MLVCELKRAGAVRPGKGHFAFLEGEFERVALSLGWKCREKINGYAYLLDLHRREAEYLLGELSRMDEYNTALRGVNLDSDLLCEVYTSLMLGLSELIERIGMMEERSAGTGKFTYQYN